MGTEQQAGAVERSQTGLRQELIQDITDFGRELEAWHAIYEQMTPGPFEGYIRELWIGEGLEILWEKGSQSIFTTGRNAAGMLTLGVPIVGGRSGTYCGMALDGNAIGYLPGATDFEIFSREELDMVSATFSEELLDAFAAERGEALRCEIHRQPMVLACKREAELLRRMLLEIVRAVEAMPELLDIDASRRAMRNCVLSLAADMLGKDTGRNTWDLHPGIKGWLVRSVRDYVLDQPQAPLTVVDLCKQFGVSRRALQYAFQEQTGLNIVLFLRNARLNAVRREIRRSGGSTAESTADVAARWGFWHQSRFSEYYRALFGELPSETRRRAASR